MLKKELHFALLFSLGLALVIASRSFSVPVKDVVVYAGSVVGISGAIEPNPYNTLAQQLKQKEDSLIAREKEVASQEQMLQSKYAQEQTSKDRMIWAMFAIMNLLIIFIAAHFFRDYKRSHVSTSAMLAH